jgi:hypothetical protein
LYQEQQKYISHLQHPVAVEAMVQIVYPSCGTRIYQVM